MNLHISEDTPDPRSRVSPEHFRLPFNELSVFEEALFVGFMDVPLLPSHLHAPYGRTELTHTPRATAPRWSVAQEAAVLGIVAVLGLILLLVLPSGDPALAEASRPGYSLAIDLDMEPAVDARGRWADVQGVSP